MRGTIAKRLRRLAFGDLSLQNVVKYFIRAKGSTIRIGESEPRRKYQLLKKDYKKG